MSCFCIVSALGTVILTALPTSAAAQSAGVDSEGLRLFWRVHDELVLDREPAPALWDSLFNTVGYAALHERERRRPMIERAMRIALRPAFADSIAAVRDEGGWIAMVLPHIRAVTAARDSVDSVRGDMEDPSFLDVARRRAAALLPGDAAGALPPPIALLIFAPDGRGYPQLIVADALHTSRKSPEDRVGFFAHELFHVFRRNIEPRVRSPAADDAALAALLGVIEEEGIADLLDKRHVPRLDDDELRHRYGDSFDYYQRYRQHFHDAAPQLRLIENALAGYAAGDVTGSEANAAIRAAIPLEGRPLGAFMAASIDNLLGRQRLLHAVADPYDFFLAYAAAALAADLPSPGASTLAVVRSLQARYGLRN